MGLFSAHGKSTDHDQRAADKAARRDEKDATKADLQSYRSVHPLEKQLNSAGMLKMWPSAKAGLTRYGPVRGGHAEFFNADAHKAWTVSRLGAGAVTGGFSLLGGRKNKGAAAINIVFGDGSAQSFNVTPDTMTMRAANRYVTTFNAYAAQLDGEAETDNSG